MNQMFIERHDSKENFVAYMETVMPTELVQARNGLAIAEWLKVNVFKSGNTYSVIETRGKYNYVYATLDKVEMSKKRMFISVLEKYGFMKTTHNDSETYMLVPPTKFDPFKKGLYGTNENNKNTIGADTIVNKKNSPKSK